MINEHKHYPNQSIPPLYVNYDLYIMCKMSAATSHVGSRQPPKGYMNHMSS